jgi:AcrR family transcriptional regulator
LVSKLFVSFRVFRGDELFCLTSLTWFIILMMLIYLTILILEKEVERKEIQEQRMKGYFIQATKEILKGEGIKAISVRNIAEQAGYSYATLYNYFKDIKDLVFECVVDFQQECAEQVKTQTENISPGVDKIKAITTSYMQYFVQYPGIFELFFLEKISDLSNKPENTERIVTFLDRLCEEEWQICINSNIYSSEEAENKAEQMKLVVTGILLYYINRLHPDSYTEFLETTDKQLALILDN